MTNEEFQRIVLEKLGSIEQRLDLLEQGQKEMKEKLSEISERTADLFEFKTETNKKIDQLIEDNKSSHQILGEHEVAIRTLQRRAV